jgi:hypothetical protein
MAGLSEALRPVGDAILANLEIGGHEDVVRDYA